MGWTDPYRQKNYMGEHASDAAALAHIRANKWDSTLDGLGDARPGMVYYNTASHHHRQYADGAWFALAEATVETIHLYVNGSTGSDSNSGFTVGAPLLNLQTALDRLPYHIRHNCAIHCAGIMLDQGQVNIDKDIKRGIMLLIDGGDDVTSVAGPYAMDQTHQVDLAESTSATFSVDEHTGKQVRVIGGPSDGVIRAIYQTTINGVYFICDIPADPGPTDQFEIVVPATQWASSVAPDCTVTINTTGGGNVEIQRLTLIGNAVGFLCFQNSVVNYHGIYSESSYFGTFASFGGIMSVQEYLIDPTTFSTSATDFVHGISEMGTGFTIAIGRQGIINGIKSSILGDCFFMNGALLEPIHNGTRVIGGLQFVDFSGAPFGTSPCITDTGGICRTTKIGGSSTSGMDILHSNINIGGGVVIGNNGEHGIKVRHSSLRLGGNVTGTGNAGAGVYAYDGSSVTISGGDPATITGTVGDVAVIDPAVEHCEWSDVVTESRIAVAEEMTTLRAE